MKIGFFEEKSGVWSFTRLISAALIATGILIALLETNYCMWFNNLYEPHSAMIGELVGFGITGKVVQKIFGEKEVK